ncbi:MAG: metallophosphoesterase family protein [Chitinophagales bacterium]
MKRIGILSDTHGFLDPTIFEYFTDCDEIWHAGDFGNEVSEALEIFKLLRGVHGNIDGNQVRKSYPAEVLFNCEDVKIFMTHIGGYPPRFEPGIRNKLQNLLPDIFICGHSHILKITRDPGLNNLLCINPGAAGKAGLHKVRTIIRLKIEGKKIFDLEVIELGKKGQG